jgi:lambda repressor-like predicted transcriptional regulator
MATPAPIVLEVARAVLHTLTTSGITIRAASDHTGIPYQTLRRKLAGDSEFKFSELNDLARFLRVPPWTFTPGAFVPERVA